MIIDAKNLIVGRIATVAAKKALLGEKVIIINSEQAVMSGKKGMIMSSFKVKRERGSVVKGPFYPKRADRILRRSIRGMIPYKLNRGKLAYERVMCYLGVPDEFKNQKAETIPEADSSKIKNVIFIPLKEISNTIGAKI